MELGRFNQGGQYHCAWPEISPNVQAENVTSGFRHEMLVMKQRKQVLKNISFFGHLFQYILATVKGEVDPLYHYLGQSELVNHSAESGVDFFQLAVSLHSVTLAFFLIPFNQRSRLVVVNVEALTDGLFVVVSTS